MAYKMKLIPEDVYLKLMQMNQNEIGEKTQEELDKEKKKNIVAEQSIPEDVKFLLLQNLTRQLVEKQLADSRKPLLVENVLSGIETPPIPPPDSSKLLLDGTSKRGASILNFLVTNGLVLKPNHVEFAGNSITNEQMNAYLNSLCNGIRAKFDSDSNFNMLLNFIKKAKPDKDMFPAGVFKVIKRQTGNGMKRRNVEIKFKKWTHY